MNCSKVFCLGLSRTGTTSLHHAFLELGLRSQHFSSELLRDRNSAVIDEYDAFSDVPIPMIYRHLDELYPESRFILTTREKEPWLDSMKWLFTQGKVKWWWGNRVHEYHKNFYGTYRYNSKKLSEKYDSHHREIQSYFKSRPKDLLVINIDQGLDIELICEFLSLSYRPITPAVFNVREPVSLKRRASYAVTELRQTLSRLRRRT